MNFSFHSRKLSSKPQNEDFVFEKETPRGHFFAVLDFAPHDYANLNATLEGKLETIVGSFASLSRFSADLFLEFLAREINNFLHHLGEQSDGPEMLCSAALTLVNGNRLSYLICGNVSIDILSKSEVHALNGGRPEPSTGPIASGFGTAIRTNDEVEQLGAIRLETTITDRVQAFALRDDDIVLIMTQALAESVHGSLNAENNVSSLDPEAICDELLHSNASIRDDLTVVAIGGPYEQERDPVLSDLNRAIAALEAKVNGIVASRERGSGPTESTLGDDAQRGILATEIENLKVALNEKAATADLAQLDEKFRRLTTALASKTESSDLPHLQQSVSQFGVDEDDSDNTQESSRPSRLTIMAAAPQLDGSVTAGKIGIVEREPEHRNGTVARPGSHRTNFALVGLLVLLTGVAAAFGGAWLQSRVFGRSPESWLVRTTSNQLFISRIDGTGESAQRTVSLNVTGPLKSTGEQTFSSFADVKQYIDAVSTPPSVMAAEQGVPAAQRDAPAEPAKPIEPPRAALRLQPVAKTPLEVVTPITAEAGDSLRAIAQRYEVAPEKLRQLNPSITRWTAMARGQKVIVPVAARRPAQPARKPSPAGANSNRRQATIEVTVAPGDSLNRFVLRYKSTPARLKALNPRITNWSSIQAGQKVRVPAPTPGG